MLWYRVSTTRFSKIIEFNIVTSNFVCQLMPWWWRVAIPSILSKRFQNLLKLRKSKQSIYYACTANIVYALSQFPSRLSRKKDNKLKEVITIKFINFNYVDDEIHFLIKFKLNFNRVPPSKEETKRRQPNCVHRTSIVSTSTFEHSLCRNVP